MLFAGWVVWLGAVCGFSAAGAWLFVCYVVAFAVVGLVWLFLWVSCAFGLVLLGFGLGLGDVGFGFRLRLMFGAIVWRSCFVGWVSFAIGFAFGLVGFPDFGFALVLMFCSWWIWCFFAISGFVC